MVFPADISGAEKVQRSLKKKVRIKPLETPPACVAGVDAAFIDNKIIAVASRYTYPEIVPVEDVHVIEPVHFPYVPGYLSFREGPAIIHAVTKLSERPDLIICDGQGIAHPEGMGIACHTGVLLNIPSIGCAKSRLVGTYTMPGDKKGSHTPLMIRGRKAGAVLRTRDNVKPVFVSPGHLIDITGAVNIVLTCTGKYRLPEPIRRADLLAGELKSSIALRSLF